MNVPISAHVWREKYRHCPVGGAPEPHIESSWWRVARAVASVENRDRERWASAFFDLLADFRFLPGGRVLAGAGTGKRVTLFNCFVQGLVPDSLPGILERLCEGALTMQQGGGIGCDFSTLRPRGTVAEHVGAIASGPVSFMRIWDGTCATLLSTGARRGAMMATLRCDHPDIEEFIAAKREPGVLRHFNLSVLVTDDFMQAVADDDEWPLVFPVTDGDASTQDCRGPATQRRRWSGSHRPRPCRVVRTLRARALWDRIMRAAYDYAEPGVLFIDGINRGNNLSYCEAISATNPCGEIPLPPHGACDLGSLNLVRFVREPFTASARVDEQALAAAARLATRFLDNIIDLSAFPLPSQARQAKASRRIGLGITGLADALLMLGLRYDEERARERAAALARVICHAAYEASTQLALEKGCFPNLQLERYLRAPFVRALPDDLRRAIAERGMRNSHVTAVAPAGTISLLANCVSSGVEPIFQARHTRAVLGVDGVAEQFQVEDYACRLWRELGGEGSVPPAFVSHDMVSPEAHLRMQAALQTHVDNAISKTVNVPVDLDFDGFRALYRRAFELGLKGCTAFRPNPVTGEVLAVKDEHVLDAHCCTLEREAD